NKPLTKADLISTLKEVGVVTKKDLINYPTKDDLKTELGKSEHRLERRLVIRMNKMERSLRQSIASLAETTPTRQEFEVLKHSSNYGLV
ncbi:MAG: hypothetical protein U0946_04160, partial [Patescibacteria group bacterium]|nr:hypothetical protein [Patescibacteria group bacterium]